MRIFGIGKLCGSEMHEWIATRSCTAGVALGPEPANRRGESRKSSASALWIEQMANSG